MGNRKINEEAIHLIKKCEGFRTLPYVCEGGKLTIGYGHVIRPGEEWMKEGITHEQGDEILHKDLSTAEQGVETYITVPLTDAQFGALVSFTFNVGIGALQYSTLRKKLNANNYEGAADELLRWVYAGGHVSKGLQQRREWERELFLTGKITW
jgi:lysozyme